MTVAGLSSGSVYRDSLTVHDAILIYKARFTRLWQVLKLSLSAAAIAVLTVILSPVMLGLAVFSRHFYLIALLVSFAALLAAWLFWQSFKLALGNETH